VREFRLLVPRLRRSEPDVAAVAGRDCFGVSGAEKSSLSADFTGLAARFHLASPPALAENLAGQPPRGPFSCAAGARRPMRPEDAQVQIWSDPLTRSGSRPEGLASVSPSIGFGQTRRRFAHTNAGR